MKNIGFIGLGNMGISMSENLVKNGFNLTGFDLSQTQLDALRELGGTPATTCKEVGENSEAVFIMVLNGNQVKSAIFDEEGLLAGLKPGSTIIVSATIHPSEIREIEQLLSDTEIRLVDTPVSGGKPGAAGGTLTMMTAAPQDVFDNIKPVLEAVGKNIFHVGEEIGLGQTVKASLQALIGSSFTAIFESLVLGVKSGASAEVLYEVFSKSGVGSPLFENAASLIMDRKFKDTGSHIGTMYKDLGITMSMAKENGVSMFTTSAAFELFQAGISLFPEEDNWSIVKLLEQIAGTTVQKSARFKIE
ncbi:MAG: NAD(P)-dependent oxidoreductase [Candidatus Latescibacteria bacterium]|jgi:3-hydroxyisobutyrate dehydrogenase-like beta-hydroxyacid dehydrogenase|nr:NAD(P)-dependent oxidoreductase [Candidatus Latescibacterota bacterium]